MIWKNLCHIERLSAFDIFNAVLIEACDRSSIPIACVGLVDAWFVCIPSISVTSVTIAERKCDPSSDRISVGKYTCLVMTSTIVVQLFLLLHFELDRRIECAKTHIS